jgi:hypothetical protein
LPDSGAASSPKVAFLAFEFKMSKPKLFLSVRPGVECKIHTIQEGAKSGNDYEFKFNVEAMHFLIRLISDWNCEVSIYANHPMTAEWEAFCQMRGIQHSIVEY